MAKARAEKNGNFVHGLTRTPTYNTWRGMIERCTNPFSIGWEDYGGRGIEVCDEWFDFTSFYADMGLRPEGKTLDRIDPDRGYCKENCRWATLREQALNKPSIPTHEFAGLIMSFGEWAELVDIPRRTLAKRFYQLGWSIADTLTTPIKKFK